MSIPDKLQALAALAGRTVLEARPLGSESRNSLWRATLDGNERAVLKIYDHASDPHAANRFRREEKVLALLGGDQPALAPRVIAGFISPSASPMLLMEDVGARSLADVLSETSQGASKGTWDEAIAFVSRLHAEMERRRRLLYRTAVSITLDRITGPVLLSRFRIASRRLAGTDAPTGASREYRLLMAPILAAPRAMIHNSMSPLNIVPAPEIWRAVDWETLACASPLWDWADLLRSPYAPLPFDECAEIAGNATRCGVDLFHRAVLSRCLDGLATVTMRMRRFREDGIAERETEYARRAACYACDVRTAAARLGVSGALADWIEKLTGGEA